MSTATRKCTGCKERFSQALETWRPAPVGHFHDNDCQIAYARKRVTQGKKARTVKLKRDFNANDRSFQVKKTQTIFNKYIRERDAGFTCITCKTGKTNIQYHAGHYLSVGAAPQHRFNPINCHKQCARCNNWLSGNVALYRLALVEFYGIAVVEALEADHKAKKYGVEALKVIQKWNNRKLKRLQR